MDMANIRVNEAQWNQASEEERKSVTDLFQREGALEAGDQMIPDPSTPEFDPHKTIDLQWNPIKDACEMLCDGTALKIASECSLLTGGAAITLCLAGAEAFRQECRKHC